MNQTFVTDAIVPSLVIELVLFVLFNLSKVASILNPERYIVFWFFSV